MQQKRPREGSLFHGFCVIRSMNGLVLRHVSTVGDTDFYVIGQSAGQRLTVLGFGVRAVFL